MTEDVGWAQIDGGPKLEFHFFGEPELLTHSSVFGRTFPFQEGMWAADKDLDAPFPIRHGRPGADCARKYR